MFAFDSNGDGVTGKVDGDWTKRISKAGGAFAAMTVTVTEMENGFYSLTLSSSHTDTLGVLTVSLSATGVKRVNVQFRVHARVPDDLAFPTTSGRSIDVTATGAVGIDWANVENPTTTLALTGTTIATTQQVDVNTIKTQTVACSAGVTVGAFVGQGTAAIGVNASGHVSRVVLCDTITTYTGDTPQTGDSYARIGATGSGLTSLAPSATALSTVQWTNARAGYLDNINNANLASVPAFPSNFASLGINVSGHISRVTLVDTTTTNTDMVTAAPTVSQIWTTVLTESYATDGAAFTAAQGLFMVWSALSEFAISGTTITAKKLDGSTTAMTFTLDSSSAPTSRTRAS